MPIQGRRPVTTGAENGTLTQAQKLERVYATTNSSKDKAIAASKILATDIFHNKELNKLNISRLNRVMIVLFSEGLRSSKFEKFITRIACTILFNNMGHKYDESCSGDDEVDDNRETHIEDDGKFVNVKTQKEIQEEKAERERLAKEKRENEARLAKEKAKLEMLIKNASAKKAREEMLERKAAAKKAKEDAIAGPSTKVKNDDPMPLLTRITDRTSELAEKAKQFLRRADAEEYAQEEVFNLIKDGPVDNPDNKNLLSQALGGTIVGFQSLRDRLTRREEKKPETELRDGSSLLSELGMVLEDTTEEFSRTITELGQAFALTKENATKRLKGLLRKREALDLTQGVEVKSLS